MQKSHLAVLTVEEQQQVRRIATRLAIEFTRTVGPETVERCVADSMHRLSQQASVTTFIPILSERFARERLAALTSTRSATPHTPSVLFLCTHNSGRSQIAAAWLRQLQPALTVWSAGTDPGEAIAGVISEAMAEVGIDLSDEFPKPWTDEITAAADVIITMGCGEACPVLPGKRYEDWTLAQPTGPTIEQARAARDQIRDRVTQLAATLSTTNP